VTCYHVVYPFLIQERPLSLLKTDFLNLFSLFRALFMPSLFFSTLSVLFLICLQSLYPPSLPLLLVFISLSTICRLPLYPSLPISALCALLSVFSISLFSCSLSLSFLSPSFLSFSCSMLYTPFFLPHSLFKMSLYPHSIYPSHFYDLFSILSFYLFFASILSCFSISIISIPL
jgi:hypothetical protein